MGRKQSEGGFKSRKLWLTVLVLTMIAGGFAASGHWPALAVTFPEYVMGLLAASGIYATGNSVAKVIQSKSKENPKA